MKKLLAALLAGMFAVATVSPVAFAADEKKEQTKEKAKAEKKKADDKDKK